MARMLNAQLFILPEDSQYIILITVSEVRGSLKDRMQGNILFVSVFLDH